MDRDREPKGIPLTDNVYKWDRYHIENYLLENEFLALACGSVLGSSSALSDTALEAALRACAEELVDTLVLERLQAEVNESFVNSIAVGASPSTRNPASDLMPSIRKSLERLAAAGEKYSEDFLRERQSEIRGLLEAALTNGEWRREFPGRLILKRFVRRHVPGVNYEAFRYIILIDGGRRLSAGWDARGNRKDQMIGSKLLCSRDTMHMSPAVPIRAIRLLQFAREKIELRWISDEGIRLESPTRAFRERGLATA